MTSMGGGNASPSPGEWVTLAAKSRSEGGVGRMQARIGQIETELARREATD